MFVTSVKSRHNDKLFKLLKIPHHDSGTRVFLIALRTVFLFKVQALIYKPALAGHHQLTERAFSAGMLISSR